MDSSFSLYSGVEFDDIMYATVRLHDRIAARKLRQFLLNTGALSAAMERRARDLDDTYPIEIEPLFEAPLFEAPLFEVPRAT